MRQLFIFTGLLCLLAIPLGCGSSEDGAVVDLGDYYNPDKTDEVTVNEVPFEVHPASAPDKPGEAKFSFRAAGLVALRAMQDLDRSQEQLQLAADSETFKRKSTTAKTPFLDIPFTGTDPDKLIRHQIKLLNWGTQPAYGKLRIESELQRSPDIRLEFNQPDCGPTCGDPSGELRTEMVRAIQSARTSIDMAVYGLKDPAVVEALCNAAKAGIVLRAVTDPISATQGVARSYYDAYYSPEKGILGCGAQVEPVRTNGIMHHKFLIIDGASETPFLVTGSTNLTREGLQTEHNHMVFLRGIRNLVDAYQAEFDQLFAHCRASRLDGSTKCTECSPGCVEDRSPEGPFDIPGGNVEIHFSPSDDSLRVLRGKTRSVSKEAPDPACSQADASCVCRVSGRKWTCDYCAQDADGWGLIGTANQRLFMSVFSGTDQCLALGMVKAAGRGVKVQAIWDYRMSQSASSRAYYLGTYGIPSYICNWGDNLSESRNHNKIVIVDDAVFDGSMNLSESGLNSNNENVLVMRSPDVAEAYAQYFLGEVALLESRGVTPLKVEECRCRDLIDNDADGTADSADTDCDTGQ